MNQLSTRDRILVQAVKKLKAHDTRFGDPKIVSSCAGELQRVFLKYALKSDRKISNGEHSAVEKALAQIARIACGPVVWEDSYIGAGAELAIAGECAMNDSGGVEAAFKHEREEEDLDRKLENVAEEIGKLSFDEPEQE